MVVIYDQEKTYMRKNIELAKNLLVSVYGEKLGKEAYDSLSNGRIGSSYRKFGGPLVKIVSEEEAEVIRRKEAEIGMLEA